MTYIPDCRKDEYYNQKYLTEQDKEFVRGFDWCTEQVVDNFFDNFDDCESDYLNVYLNKEVPDYMQEEYQMENSFPYSRDEPEYENRKIVTYLDYIRFQLLGWIERCRNELVVSMLDDVSDEDYEKIKSQVDGKPFSYAEEMKKTEQKAESELAEIMKQSQEALSISNEQCAMSNFSTFAT